MLEQSQEYADAIYVETAYRLWSQEATYWFYEGTGVLTSVLALPVTWFTGRFITARLGRPNAPRALPR